MRSLALHVFGWAVRLLLPPGFRSEFGDEILATVAARVAGRSAGWALLRVLLSEGLDLLRTSAREWWRVLAEPRHAPRRGSGGGWMNECGREVTAAAKALIRRPLLTLGVTLTLGLGIGATTTIFTVVDGVVVRPLPYDASSRLVTLGAVSPERSWLDHEEGLQNLEGMPWPAYRIIDEAGRTFDATAAIERSVYVLPDMGEGPGLVPVARVTPSFFDLLGVAPLLGRTFLTEEFSSSAPRVILLTYGAWQRRFGGDPSVIGAEPSGGGATVVGVLPRDFRPLEAFFPADDVPELYAPEALDQPRLTRSPPSVFVLARLSEGTSLRSARRELDMLAERFRSEDPEHGQHADGSSIALGANGLQAQTVGSSGRTIAMFFGAAVFLLLIAAMNVATLLLARGIDRARDVSVRMALGASRVRIAVAALSEAVSLSLLGGALGVVLAYAGVGAFRRFAPPSFPRLDSVGVDARVLAVAAVTAIGAGVIAGTLPALRLAFLRPWGPLRSSEGTFSDRKGVVRAILVGGQMALAVVLVTGAGLLFGSFLRIRYADPGFDPEGLVTMSENVEILARDRQMQDENPQDHAVWQYWDIVVEAAGAVPGVESVGATTNLPYEAPSWAPRVLLEGDPSDRWHEGIVGYVITPGYLETMGTEVVRGRGFTRQDRPAAERVVLVNEAFVDTYLEGKDAIDGSLRLLDRGKDREMRVVGVVENVVQARVEDGVAPAIYVPYTQQVGAVLEIAVRSPLATQTVVAGLRAAADRYNTFIPPRDQRPVADLMTRTHVTPRFQSTLIGAFALVATLLAAVGLFGSMTHAVLRRRHEIGVRMALGAGRRDVVGMVLRQGMVVAGAGLLLGAAGARFLTRGLADMLYRITPGDAATAVASVAVLVLLSLVACLAPALRATAVDPAAVLEAE